jgi:hypothetical protein
MSQPIEGTVVEAYLHRRGIAHVYHGGSLRFHPRCYYRPDEHLPTETWPAMIACVTDLDSRITGVHRRLDPDGFDRFGSQSTDRHAATGDGRLLAMRCVLAGGRRRTVAARHRDHAVATLCAPTPMASALRHHLAPWALSGLRVYIARDADAAGDTVQATSLERGATGIETVPVAAGRFQRSARIGFDAPAQRCNTAHLRTSTAFLPATALG